MLPVVADRLAYPQASLQNPPVLKTKEQSKTKLKYSIGIDLGGTKVAVALVNSKGQILTETHIPTVPPSLAGQDPKLQGLERVKAKSQDIKKHIAYVIETMADAVLLVNGQMRLRGISPKDLLGIGLASAGPMNVEEGVLEYPANFNGWKVVPLVQLLQDALAGRGLKAKISFQNDAIAAALAEGWIGRAKDCSTYAMITVGTGIGTGVILNGKPAQSRGMGSEWGHMIVAAPGFGADRLSYYERSVEGLASGTGIFRQAKARGFKGKGSAELARAAGEGDPLALELFNGASEALAALFYSLSLGYHPEKFVVSGGMLAIREHFLPQAISMYREAMRAKNRRFLAPVQVASLGTKAGVIGAARLPFSLVEELD
jgi:glucokinase